MAADARPPIGSAARPLRVVVIGSSTVFMTVPRPTAGDSVYALHLREQLAAREIAAEVTVHSQWHATVLEILPNYEAWVRDHFPDVVIINLGMAEAQARVLPTWLVRNTMTWRPGMSMPAHAYRRSFLSRTVKTAVRHLQRWAVPHVGLRWSRVRPSVFSRAMSRLVQLCLRDGAQQVLILDIDPPGERASYWMPGLPGRVDAYNRLLRDTAAEFPASHVAVVPTSEIVSVHGAELALPDGFHRSAMGHQLVGERLADIVAERLLADSSDSPRHQRPRQEEQARP